MKKNNLTLTDIRELHHQGELEQAEAGYKAMLRHNANDVDALHGLGILYIQQEKFADAIDYLQTAAQNQPENPIIALHLANAFKLQGLFSQAVQLLEATVHAHPDYLPALNNLGSVYYAQGKLEDAIRTYREAIQRRPDYADAYYNLGLALSKQNKFDDAIDAYETLITLSPNHFAARFHLACAYMYKNHFSAALNHFLSIEQEHPHHVETQINLAACYLKKGVLNEAKAHYLKALQIEPSDTQILFNLGVINMQQGNIDSAIQSYQKAVRANPDFFAAHNNLGVAFLAKQHLGYAMQHFKEAARLQPENTAIDYTIKALSQNQRLLTAPPDYISSLFDAYADHYEPHLLTALNYEVHTKLYDALIKIKKPASSSLAILDLGCGTGLCGALVAPFAESLTGVDLSEKMLAVAAEKNIYDLLEQGDLSEFLANKQAAYDWILAGDVLVYMGDLARFFTQLAQALRPGGLFAFNTEISEDTSYEDYKMNQSGRFAHQKKYLDRLAQENHLGIVSYQTGITRFQNNEPVHGHLYVLQRKS